MAEKEKITKEPVFEHIGGTPQELQTERLPEKVAFKDIPLKRIRSRLQNASPKKRRPLMRQIQRRYGDKILRSLIEPSLNAAKPRAGKDQSLFKGQSAQLLKKSSEDSSPSYKKDLEKRVSYILSKYKDFTGRQFSYDPESHAIFIGTDIALYDYADVCTVYVELRRGLINLIDLLPNGALKAVINQHSTTAASFFTLDRNPMLDEIDCEDLKEYYLTYLQFLADGYIFLQRQHTKELKEKIAELNQKKEELEGLQSEAKESLRHAFQSGDEEAIAQILNVIGTAVDLGLNIDGLAEKIINGINELGYRVAKTAGTYTSLLKSLNKTLTVVNALFAIKNPGKELTKIREGRQYLDNLMTIFSVATTFVELAPHVGLYFTLYFSPALKIVLQSLDFFSEQQHDRNTVMMEIGKPDLVNWDEEPGGKRVYSYMAAVMKADSLSAVKNPAEAVAKFFYDQKSRFKAVAQKAVPVNEGELDKERFQAWVYRHRVSIWFALYGSWDVPE